MRQVTSNDWQNFIQGIEDPLINDKILDSWNKCRSLGVDPFLITIPKEEHPDLQETSKYLIEGLRKFIDRSVRAMGDLAVAWLLSDPAGMILEIDSVNQTMKEILNQINIAPGAKMDLANAGTSAISLSIEYKKPSLCNGSAHYLQQLHRFSSAAAPFYELDGTLKAYVVLIGMYPETDARLLRSIINSLILVIDRDIRLNRSKKSANHLKTIFSSFFQNDAQPMIMVTRNGYVRQLNYAAIKLFGMDESNFEEKSVDKLASFEPSVKEIVKSAIPVKNSAMKIQMKKRLLHVTFDKMPLYSDKDEFLGVLLTFHEKSEKASPSQTDLPVAKYTFDDIIGQTPALAQAKELAIRAAATSVSVLLTGESGTGKEMFAQSIHNISDRKNETFISINCAAIPRDIAESELFGYGSGAFTGASRRGNMGKLEAANKGTVFLDEIGDMPLDLQSKLLRVLESKTITRIGESKERPVNIRIIAATNKDIQERVRNGQFREDLYYRLSVTSIPLPSLRASREDIPEITQNFIEYFNEVMGKMIHGVQPEIMTRFMQYSWPGNIRELRNAIEFAVMLNSGEEWVTWKDLPGQLRMDLLYSQAEEGQKEQDPLFEERQGIENSEKILYQKAIKMANGNMSKAAKILNVGRATLYRKIRKFELR